jgi:hypothetical protein
MVIRDVVALFLEHMPDDEIRSMRDSIAKAEAELAAPMWERHRELHGRIEELRNKCEAAAHSLTIVFAAPSARGADCSETARTSAGFASYAALKR